MATLRILVPDSTVNYIKNPSIRFDTTGWTSYLANISRSLDYARFGFASLKVETVGATLYEGAYYRVSTLSGITSPVTVSAYLLGTGRVRIRLIDNPFGHERIGETVTLRADRWTRVHVTGQTTGSDDLRLYVETDQVKAVTFYVDGAQMELKPYPTTYCDGDQEGCRWNILSHNSNSIRDGHTRAGGRWVTISGEDRPEQDLYMTVVGGMGLPPITNNLQSYADAPGSFYQNTKVMARPITFTFHAKHENKTLECSPQSLDHLHRLRQLLIDLVKPDKTRAGEEFILEYQDGNIPLYLKAIYDGGLEGDWDVRNSWINSFPLRVLAVSPFFYEDNQRVSALDFQWWGTVEDIAARVDGVWNNMNYGLSNNVYGLTLGTRGEVVAVGQFGTANNNALAVDPLRVVNGIAYWDGTKWNAYGSGANNSIFAVAVAPNGYVYVTGVFTAIGGVAANYVAYWNGSAWNAMGSGLNNQAGTIAVAPNGDVYVGGTFTTAGGINAQKIARWDGSSWHAVGIYGGLNSDVGAIIISPDGESVYAGGTFGDEATNPGSGLSYVAKYDTSTGLWEALGDGFDSSVSALKISPSGVLYAGGIFLNSGSLAINRIGYWNGATWLPLGSGVSGLMEAAQTIVDSIDVQANGELIIAGDFTEAGGVDARGVALWNGSSWTNLDIVAAVLIRAVLYDTNGNIYLGVDNPVHTGAMTIVNNTGSAESNPILFISGPATFKFIENYTSKRRVYLDLDILSGEEVYMDFGRGKIFSSIRGDLFYAVAPGSDLRAFSLLPGENQIVAFMVEDVGASMYISYVPRHWSADATERGEEL